MTKNIPTSLAWEGLRRQDQIRFGTWGKAWDFKEPSED